tara:strand:+ start:265 stop:570 length:306 start_codon:yes stop_codon:yes gene_type:complete
VKKFEALIYAFILLMFSTGTILFLLFGPGLKLIYFKEDAIPALVFGGLFGGYMGDRWLLNPLQNTFNSLIFLCLYLLFFPERVLIIYLIPIIFLIGRKLFK